MSRFNKKLYQDPHKRLHVVMLLILLIAVTIAVISGAPLLNLGFVLGLVIYGWVWTLVYFLQKKQAEKKADLIADAMRQQGVDQAKGMRPDKRQIFEPLQRSFDQAIAELKHDRSLQSRRGKAALAELPWYVVVGPPGHGKTVAIKNSGLHFPKGGAKVKGLGGTKNCDWFFGSSAILLDTAGRYTVVEEDRKEWLSFLGMIRKHRSRRPLNGIIVGFSLPDLRDATQMQIEEHAEKVQKLVYDMMGELGFRIPVYLMFTKSDLIPGFREYFENLNASERSQVFGTTFNKTQMDFDDKRNLFEEEFQLIVEKLYDRRPKLLDIQSSRQSRYDVYTFPMSFEDVGQQICHFIDRLCEPNPYAKEQLMLRGFYFTSGMQAGEPINRIIERIAYKLGIRREEKTDVLQTNHDDSPENSVSYFLRDFFEKVVLEDQYLATYTEKTTKLKRYSRLIAHIGLGIVALFLFLSLYRVWWSNNQDIDKVRDILNAISTVDWNRNSIIHNFQILDKAGLQLDSVYFTGPEVGLYHAAAAREKARGELYNKLQIFIQDRIFESELPTKLNQCRKNSEVISRQENIDHLKAYLLLSERVDSLSGETDFLTEHLTDAIINMSKLSIADRWIVSRPVGSFVDVLKNNPERGFQPDISLVQATRICLRKPHTFDDLYQRLLHVLHDLTNNAKLAMSDILSPRQLQIVNSSERISIIFTQAIYSKYVKNNIVTVSTNRDASNWVLGEGAIRSTSLDRFSDEQIIEQLEERYFNDYSDAWKRFLLNIEYLPFLGLTDARQKLTVLADIVESPIAQLIEKVVEETRFVPRIASQAAQATGQQGARSLTSHAVDDRYRGFHKIKDGDESGNSMGTLLDIYGTVRHAVENKLENEDPSAVADYAALTINKNTGELPNALARIANSTNFVDSEIRSVVFERPIVMVWLIILDEVKKHLNLTWKSTVQNEFENALEGYYPIEEKAQDVVSLADFVNFFKGNGGTLDDYLINELDQFIDVDSRNFRSRRGKGALSLGIELTNPALISMQKALAIRHGLGIENRKEPIVNFRVKPLAPPEQIACTFKFTLVIEDKSLNYDVCGYEPTENFVWPGSGGQTTIKVDFGYGRPFSVPADASEWAFFRLIDQGTLRGRGRDYTVQFQAKTREGQPFSIIYNIKAASVNNPFSNNFFRYYCPKVRGNKGLFVVDEEE